jgi:hypothetical protein
MESPLSASDDAENDDLEDHDAPEIADEEPAPPPPEAIAELAEACVAYVERALGVRLDYEAETLPLLDHYLATARADVTRLPESEPLLVSTAGAYFGEVLRRRHPSHWFLGDDPSAYRIELEVARLVVHPMSIISECLALGTPTDEGFLASLVLSLEDRDALAKRLEELPEVTDEELFAPSTRLEVIDIALDLLHGRRLGMN